MATGKRAVKVVPVTLLSSFSCGGKVLDVPTLHSPPALFRVVLLDPPRLVSVRFLSPSPSARLMHRYRVLLMIFAADVGVGDSAVEASMVETTDDE